MPANWNAYSGSLIVSFLMPITIVLMLQRSLSCTVCKFYSRLKFLGLDFNAETFLVTIFKFLYELNSFMMKLLGPNATQWSGTLLLKPRVLLNTGSLASKYVYCLYVNQITCRIQFSRWFCSYTSMSRHNYTELLRISALTVFWSSEFGYHPKLTRISEKELRLCSVSMYETRI